MRLFVVICMVTAVFGDDLGYNYQPLYHYDNGVSLNPAASGLNPNYFAPQGHNPSATNEHVSYSHKPEDEYEKEFYTYSAKEEDFAEPAATNQNDNSVKQGLRVIFIKGPENSGLENAAVKLVKQINEQKTNIYVLQKQSDLSSLAKKFNTINVINNNQPEVHFVKYHTPEDAANAQKVIQEQYDSLGGHSLSHDGGAAPALNFASEAPADHVNHSTSPDSSHNANTYTYSNSVAEEPKNSYLPASILQVFRI